VFVLIIFLASRFDPLLLEIRSYRFASKEELEECRYGVHELQCQYDFGPSLLLEVPLPNGQQEDDLCGVCIDATMEQKRIAEGGLH